jgi:hypothetical protein
VFTEYILNLRGCKVYVHIICYVVSDVLMTSVNMAAYKVAPCTSGRSYQRFRGNKWKFCTFVRSNGILSETPLTEF